MNKYHLNSYFLIKALFKQAVANENINKIHANYDCKVNKRNVKIYL